MSPQEMRGKLIRYFFFSVVPLVAFFLRTVQPNYYDFLIKGQMPYSLRWLIHAGNSCFNQHERPISI